MGASSVQQKELNSKPFRKRQKTATRRNGWSFLSPGDAVNAVEKARGLKKGEKVKRLCRLRIVSVRAESLDAITDEDVALEGFPGWSAEDFVRMYAAHNRCPGDCNVNRIAFEYL